MPNLKKNKKNNLAVVLSGANGHLGKHILLKIIKSHNVIGISRNATKIFEIIPKERRLNYFPLDTDYESHSVEKVSKEIEKIILKNKLKLIGLVNNGITGNPKSSDAIDKKSVTLSAEGIFGFHVRFAMNLSTIMKPPASIINISSMYGRVAPNPSIYSSEEEVNPLLYGAMKAALIQGSKYLSSKLAPQGIRVNSVSFGPFPSLKVQNNNRNFIKSLANQTHLKRIGTPEESAGIIEFLLSNDSSYITGADIPVDGGWTAW